MNDNLQFQITYRKIINIAWIVAFCVSVILLVAGYIAKVEPWYHLALSFLLGAMTNFFAFNLLKNNVANLTDDVKTGISGSYSNYAIRLLIYAGVLFIAYNNVKLNVYVVASGFITIRIAIYIYTFLNKNK